MITFGFCNLTDYVAVSPLPIYTYLLFHSRLVEALQKFCLNN